MPDDASRTIAYRGVDNCLHHHPRRRGLKTPCRMGTSPCHASCSVHPFLNSGILVHETTCTRELNNVTERRGLLWLARNTTFSPGVDLPERPLRVLRAERLGRLGWGNAAPVKVPRAALRRGGEGAELLVRGGDEELGK